MSMINKRIFGADILPKIKQKLEARQNLAEKSLTPGESITSRYASDTDYTYKDLIDNDFNMEADLSSRTPFVRMWTAVQLVQNVKTTEEAYTETLYESEEFDTVGTESTEEGYAPVQDYYKILQQHPGSKVQEITQNGKTKFVVTKKVDQKTIDTASPLSGTKIYEIGNHILNTISKTSPNQQITSQQTDKEKSEYTVFPNELGVSGNNNKFFKPPAGIVSLESETDGTLGVVKKTNINFKVNNFHDFDKIYNKYFLRPGAQVFVDFGWNTSKLYDQKTLIESKTIMSDLYGLKGEEVNLEHIQTGEKINKKVKEDGFVTRTNGDMETVVGVVTNYSSNILEDGTVECSLEITSKNQTMLTLPKGDYLKRKMDFTLDYLIQFEALYTMGGAEDRESLLQQQPDSNSSIADEKEYEDNLTRLAISTYGSGDYNPTLPSILSGVFVAGDDLKSTEKYISFGLFEDRIINSEFGFGKNGNDINENVENFEVASDSSKQFITYNDIYKLKQAVMANTEEKPPKFLIPHFWDKSYSSVRGKSPRDNEEYKNITVEEVDAFKDSYEDYMKNYRNKDDSGEINPKQYTGPKPITNTDINLKRMPLREIFIRTDVIKDAFGDATSNVEEVYQYVCDQLRENSYEIFDLKVSGVENQIQIIDFNFNDMGSSQLNQEDKYNNLFMFNVQSANSIVKSYDVSLELPTGAIGSMYAIQGVSGTGGQLYPITDLFHDLGTFSALYSQSDKTNDKDNTYVSYLPEIGSYRVKQMSDDVTFQSDWRTHTQDIQSLVTDSSGDMRESTTYSGVVDNEVYLGFFSEEDKKSEEPQTDEEKQELESEIVKKRQQKFEEQGFIFLDTFEDYFKQIIGVDFKKSSKASPLPIKLNLSTYGISTLIPGDIFRVDYLPEMYLNKVYFQIIKIKHQVGTDGWYTSIESQFRIRNDAKISNIFKAGKAYFLSPNLVKNIGIDDKDLYKYDVDYPNPSFGLNNTFNKRYIDKKDLLLNKGFVDSNYKFNTMAEPIWVGTGKQSHFGNQGEVALVNNEPTYFIKNFGELASRMSKIQPISTTGMTNILLIFKFTITLEPKTLNQGTQSIRYVNEKGFAVTKEEGTSEWFAKKFGVGGSGETSIAVINPQYFYNTGYQVDTYNGYGSYFCKGAKIMQFKEGDEAYLIVNRNYPDRHWAVSPAMENYHPSGNKFKQLYDINTIDLVDRKNNTWSKRREEEGGADVE